MVGRNSLKTKSQPCPLRTPSIATITNKTPNIIKMFNIIKPTKLIHSRIFIPLREPNKEKMKINTNLCFVV